MNPKREPISTTDEFDSVIDVRDDVIERNRHAVATPRTHHSVEEYRPAADRSYYRNDGNKHIKSRGL